jgi:hypothetical protein
LIISYFVSASSGGKLASLEEFRIQREELLSQTAKLEAMLAEQANAHREAIYELEKKQVIDKDKYVDTGPMLLPG